MIRRVDASCIVDLLRPGLYEVCVSGLAPFDCRRTYNIRERTEDRAAQEGLRMFVEEMETLRDMPAGANFN